eukprot:GILK01002346.1.p1 GENE.GILK01002346.1~~GILK01002346.1.p1  ORF type:complete len:716 (-),score=140.00 GILK01002346.1:205-2352(-)
MGFGDFLITCGIFTVLTVASSRLAIIPKKLGLPLISGYLLVGVLCGEYSLNLLGSHHTAALFFISQVALAYIAFSAGAELYLPELRHLFRTIMYMTGALFSFTFVLCALVIFLLAQADLMPFGGNQPSVECKFSLSLVAASIMTTSSPASTIAIVKEMRAKGPFTSSLLGITVFSDVCVLVLFTVTVSLAQASCFGREFDILSFLALVVSLSVAILLGFLFGKLLLALLWMPKLPGQHAILPIGYAIFVASTEITEWSLHHWGIALNFEPLLICIVAGFIATNQSKHRMKFLRYLQSAGPIVFIPFFTLTGANLDLAIVLQGLGFTALVSLFRPLTIFAGTAFGGHLTKAPKSHTKYMWMTLVAQAGVSLGLAAESAIALKEYGNSFQSTIISIVVVNQLIGPVFMKAALKKVGEAGAGKEVGEHGDEEQAAVLVGIDEQNIAGSLVRRLLEEQYQIHIIHTNQTELDQMIQIKSAIDEEAHEAAKAHGEPVEPNHGFVQGYFVEPGSDTDSYAVVLRQIMLEQKKKVQVVVTSLGSDPANLAVGTVASEMNKNVKVISLVRNPEWIPHFEELDIFPVFPHSLSIQFIHRLISTNTKRSLALLAGPLSVSTVANLHHEHEPMFLSTEAQTEFDTLYPPPVVKRKRSTMSLVVSKFDRSPDLKGGKRDYSEEIGLLGQHEFTLSDEMPVADDFIPTSFTKAELFQDHLADSPSGKQ